MTQQHNIGIHIVLDLYGCKTELLTNREKGVSLLEELLLKHNLTPLTTTYQEFEGGGYSAVVVLSESHFSIHTWPEKNGYVAADIYVCNYSRDNTYNAKRMAEEFIEHFKPEEVTKHEIIRPMERIK